MSALIGHWSPCLSPVALRWSTWGVRSENSSPTGCGTSCHSVLCRPLCNAHKQLPSPRWRLKKSDRHMKAKQHLLIKSTSLLIVCIICYNSRGQIIRYTLVRNCTSFCRQLISFLSDCTSFSLALSKVWKAKYDILISPWKRNQTFWVKTLH